MWAILVLDLHDQVALEEEHAVRPPVAACANSFCGVPDWVNVKNGAFTRGRPQSSRQR
jgi:hypothetical protein